MHELQSLHLNDEDSTNYVVNDLVEDTSHSDPINNDSPADDVMPDQENETSSVSNTLIVTPVPSELFDNATRKVNRSTLTIGYRYRFILQEEFERLFRTYDEHIVVLYLKFFQRVRITFSSTEQASQARSHLHDYPFHAIHLKTYFACVGGAALDI
jgi:hypothetical protein